MTASEFYTKRIKEEPTIGSVQLMDEYAKYLIMENLCDGSSIYFKELKINELETMHHNVSKLVDYCNS